MAIGKQFTGSLQPGQYWEWFTWGWPHDRLVNWYIRPSPGHVGNVALRALSVELARDGTLTYYITVWNVGSDAVTFDAYYDYDDIPHPILVSTPKVVDSTLLQQVVRPV